MTADSKVAWFEWSDEAFRKAQAEDKPIVLDLGASWCHGSRVMDRETYGDAEVAGLLNRDYVPVRVDSDLRPDLYDRYNLGGWPTTAFLTPTGELLGGTTYVPRNQMVQLLAQLKAGFTTHRHKIAEEIARRDEKIAEVLRGPAHEPVKLGMEIFRKTIRGVLAQFDPVHAGFGKAPKHPLVASLRVILQALHETQGTDFQTVFIRTLDAMGDRGMYDHDGGGFFHYVTHDQWTAPRFEKIAEDNAGLIELYLDAALVTGLEKYTAKALHTLEWANGSLCDASRGVFYGSQYADEDWYMTPAAARKGRPAPPVDRRVLVPASAAMASAYLRAAQVIGEEELARMALKGLDWLLRECVTPEGVAHYHDGAPRLFTLARDRIALGSALLDAWDHTGEERWIEAAERVSVPLFGRFWSEAEHGLVDRAVDALDHGELSQLRRNIAENALAAETFARLWHNGRGEEHRERAARLITAFPDLMDGYGHPTAEYALAADWLVRPPEESEPGDLKTYRPRRVVRRRRS